LLWIFIAYLSGLYHPKSFKRPEILAAATVQTAVTVFVLAIIYFYTRPENDLTPKTILVFFALLGGTLSFLWRLFFRHLSHSSLPRTSIGLIGYQPRLQELISYTANNPQLGYDIRFIIDDGDLPKLPGNILTVKGANALPDLIRSQKTTILVLDKSVEQLESWQRSLFDCLPLGVSYLSLSNFYERLTGKIPLETIDKSWFLENLNLSDRKIYESFKSLADKLLAGLILVISLPFWPLIILAIRSNSQGPAIFRQNRVGKNGKIFEMLKFRTMTVSNNDFRLTAKDDQRITKVGNWLRKTRLDEIPQIINIIKGDMSFIGPRPERPEFAKELEKVIPYYRSRNLIKPGITGWDQISGEYHSPSVDDTIKKLEYDLFYLKNRSWYLDLAIMIKTLKTVISREGR
jgi:exopolysaccharide biosynthesis polyprenyl glycosylphosphotransferase